MVDIIAVLLHGWSVLDFHDLATTDTDSPCANPQQNIQAESALPDSKARHRKSSHDSSTTAFHLR